MIKYEPSCKGEKNESYTRITGGKKNHTDPTQYELEVSQETISAYEMEKYYPSVKSLIKLQNIFGVSIDYILGLSDTRYERIETNSLAQDETRLINLYRKLDSLGKERITSYLEGYINALEAQ